MSFSVTLPGQASKSYATLAKAKAFAVRKAVTSGIELEIVNTETNAVAFMCTPVQGRIFHPWERVETPAFAAPHFEGFFPAYTRKRIMATVYRAYDADAELKWLVHDGRTGNTQLVANTKQACALTKAMKGQVL